jgi:hypothetical protein
MLFGSKDESVLEYVSVNEKYDKETKEWLVKLDNSRTKFKSETQFSKEIEEKIFNVFLIEKKQENLDGYENPISKNIEYFVYIREESNIDLEKELTIVSKFERQRLRNKERDLEKESKNSYVIMGQNGDEDWEKITYTLLGKKEHKGALILQFFGVSKILKNEEINIDRTIKNSLFFDPAKLAKKISSGLTKLKEDDIDILFLEVKKILGYI